MLQPGAGISAARGNNAYSLPVALRRLALVPAQPFVRLCCLPLSLPFLFLPLVALMTLAAASFADGGVLSATDVVAFLYYYDTVSLLFKPLSGIPSRG